MKRAYGKQRLAIEDVPNMKRLLIHAYKKNKVFVEYKGRKYSKEYARFAIRVVESGLV